MKLLMLTREPSRAGGTCGSDGLFRRFTRLLLFRTPHDVVLVWREASPSAASDRQLNRHPSRTSAPSAPVARRQALPFSLGHLPE